MWQRERDPLKLATATRGRAVLLREAPPVAEGARPLEARDYLVENGQLHEYTVAEGVRPLEARDRLMTNECGPSATGGRGSATP